MKYQWKMLPLALLLMSGLLAGCGAGKTGEAEASGKETANAEASDEEDTVSAAAAPAMITFSEEQLHKGNLILVSKDYAYDFDANSDMDLVRIVDAQSFSYPVEKEEYQLSAKLIPQLDAMIRDCNEAMGTDYTSVSSAYRSKEYQQGVWDEYEELYGENYVKSYVAVPGFSEHHTGLALDLGIIYSDGSPGTFSESENAEWMAKNSYRYGFVRRYAEDKVEITGISNEAWHFRYVGQPHAAYMYEKNLCLEEYLEYLREHTSPENPLVYTAGPQTYSVFFTPEKEIVEPEGNYTVSGDNARGYVVTGVVQ